MRRIRGIVYHLQAYEGRGVTIPTVIPRDESVVQPRFPSFEAILGPEYNLQETWVEITVGKKPQRYLIAAHYDPTLPVNRALKQLVRNVDWRGELIIMRAGFHVLVTDIGTRTQALRALKK